MLYTQKVPLNTKKKHFIHTILRMHIFLLFVEGNLIIINHNITVSIYNGLQGHQGPPGTQGFKGEPGTPGMEGRQGLPGDNGRPASKGEKGKLLLLKLIY